MLLALASRPARGQELDLEDIVARIASGQSVSPLRFRCERRLASHVQVLIDLGESMEPFGRDQRELVNDMVNAIGREVVSGLSFFDAPLRGAGTGPVSSWGAYAPPPRGAPVLALTDLGVGGPPIRRERAMPDEWLDLARLLRTRGSRLVALVPYPRQRWPLGLEREMRLVTWDSGDDDDAGSLATQPPTLGARRMSDERLDARERIAKVEAARPELIELATLLSPAATIEPELLRRVRLDVLPHFGADVEADSLVQPPHRVARPRRHHDGRRGIESSSWPASGAVGSNGGAGSNRARPGSDVRGSRPIVARAPARGERGVALDSWRNERD